MVLCKVFSICLLLFVATEGKSVPKNDKEPFELNEFLLGTFGTKTFNGTWLTGDSIFHKNKDGDYILSNVNVTGQKTLVYFKIKQYTNVAIDPYLRQLD